ncbi:MAG: hypothetical protein U5M72_12945 [Pseudomonas sp.]|nr:hypothetical protein [Pseudomonas sp.]
MYYSKSTGGFYDAVIHGAKSVRVVDPEWVRPTTEITLQPGESIAVGDAAVTNDGDTVKRMYVPDMEAVPPTIEVDNPQCCIPLDAVEITAEEHAALLAGQSAGKMIVTGEDGYPFLADPPPPAPLTVEQIDALRLTAYADPVTGSDRYFSEVARLQVMGGSAADIEATRTAGTERYEAIKAQYPWP